MKYNSDQIKIQKQLRTAVWKAMDEFKMISDGDKVMVCISGGKDSYTMLDMLIHFQKYSSINYSLIAVNLDQKQPGFPEHILPNYLSEKNIDFKKLTDEITLSFNEDCNYLGCLKPTFEPKATDHIEEMIEMIN